MKKKYLGATAIEVSQAGLGTVKFGRNQGVHYPHSFDLPSDEVILDLLSYAKALGINLLDTAPAYGHSEERLGSLLTNRHDWIICSKAGEEFVNGQSVYDFSAHHIELSVEQSLKRLKTDYLDILLVHSNGEDTKIILEDNVFDTLERLKQKGWIRVYGMSTKTVEGGLLTIEQSDLAMITYNPTYIEEKKVIDLAYEKNKGIFIKKAFASGHLQKIANENPIQHSIQFILSEPGVTSIIFGTLNKNHLKANVDAMSL